jgi:hypothetical protein
MIGGIQDGHDSLDGFVKNGLKPHTYVWVSAEHSRGLCRRSALLRGYDFEVVYDGTNLTALALLETALWYTRWVGSE